MSLMIFFHFPCHGSVKASQHQPHVYNPSLWGFPDILQFSAWGNSCLYHLNASEAWYQRVSLSVIWRNLSAIATFFQLEDRDVQFDTFPFSSTLLRLESWDTFIISNKSLITNLLCFTFGIYQIKTAMWHNHYDISLTAGETLSVLRLDGTK